jgi:RNA polymerase sigma-70 factor (ECF subfamily)
LTIVRNTCYSWLRQNRRHELNTSFDPELHDIPDESSGPEHQLIREIDVQVVRGAIRELPHEFREIVVLREMHGLSYKEIGRIADLPIGTVMSRLARARGRLQKCLAAEWNPENEGGKA